MPAQAKRSAVEPGERNVVEEPQLSDNLEQFYDEDGVLHDPLSGQGRRAYRNKPTSEVRPPSTVFQDVTGVTAEQGMPQPGPALDALHDAGAVDDAEYEKRAAEINEPARIFREKQARRDEQATRATRAAEEQTIGKKPSGESKPAPFDHKE